METNENHIERSNIRRGSAISESALVTIESLADPSINTQAWKDDTNCIVCHCKFGKGINQASKYFCKFCFRGVCANCSENRFPIVGLKDPQRCCDNCYENQSKSNDGGILDRRSYSLHSNPNDSLKEKIKTVALLAYEERNKRKEIGNKIKILEENIKEAETEINELKNNKNIKRKENFERKIDDLMHENEFLKNEKNTLKEDLSEKDEKIAKLQRTIRNLEQEGQEKDILNKKLEEKNKELKQWLKKLENERIADTQQIMDGLQILKLQLEEEQKQNKKLIDALQNKEKEEKEFLKVKEIEKINAQREKMIKSTVNLSVCESPDEIIKEDKCKCQIF
ncbi:unnamed protein product [Blepharisma stoltei]|uniref:FYVE-type domain-containing protein n=1 Tax=Blepharisma stoltei TaxID=1481888 RepID=A0AAU9JH06_9CILI|nr:unnamed protein product [Blepharisma stoltei]